MDTDVVSGEPSRLRADARRNRERILRAAMRRFAAEGIDASLDDIAREAEVGAGTLYRHFPSREALLAAALQDRQKELLAQAQQARAIADSGAALGAWLTALQDYLRSFNGLPAPVLAAVKEQESPLCLSCNALVSLTDEFLRRAQRDGHARPTVSANELFLSALGLAWVLNRAEACGTTRQALEKVLAHGYLAPAGEGAAPG
ncbi:TetR/AcrR family transcriptional regulator [Ancylobacter oerskovii]|uniref:TetR/AcrR family transcriptional regulator n=1 Tax=Ancylobacter oerskovii TaxID=459519 RepID=A0ABW4YW79_9HYPH|nr:TetR/AcrR family transcriptional regulator [Ancylobacter oerskovii]MBS7544260.1 TetR/AcrR family transcriptional regulator [Ancylobacter oerskovii]